MIKKMMLKKMVLFLPVFVLLPLFSFITTTARADLIVHLEFEGNFNDSSGNGLNGAPEGDTAIVFDASLNSNVLSLDGDDDVVRIDSGDFIASGFDLLEEVSVAMWVYTNQDISGTAFSGGMNTDWAPGGVHFKLNNGLVNVGINGGSGDVVGTTVLPVGEWHHIAVTASILEGIVAVYYDGVEEGLQEADILPVFFDFALNPVIGAWDNGGDIQREWSGFKDNIRIYNNALTAEEVQAIFESTTPSSVADWSIH